MFYHNCSVMFVVIGSSKEGYAPQWQLICYAGSDQVVMPDKSIHGAVEQEALEHNDAVDESLRYISSSMFHTLHTMVENSQLYTAV